MSTLGINRLDKPFIHILKLKYPYNRQITEIYRRFRGDFRLAAKVLMPYTNPKKEWHRLKHSGIGTLSIDEPGYPKLLKNIFDPPLLLYYRGRVPDSKLTSLAIVGSRAMTSYGEKTTEIIIKNLSLESVAIVSGLALGIDSTAHQSALKYNIPTIAILGSGLDDNSIYPASNIELAKQILKNKGTLLSEFPPGTKPLKQHFPLRNRIIAGICKAVLVIEAAEGSGALITVRVAIEENRDVFAVPGSIFEPQSIGTNRLIQEGANPLLSVNDLSAYLTNLNSTG